MFYSILRWPGAAARCAVGLSALLCGGACSVGSSERDGASGSGGAAGSGDGGGGIAGANPEGGSAGVASDTTAPYVVGFDVGDDATRAGVRKDANIVISFSEPMDPVATQLGYQSADLPAATAVLTWDDTGSVLTVNPSAELAYATGTNPTTAPAAKYGFTVTATARDRAGNSLSAPFVAEFTTLRRITQTIALRATEGTTITGAGVRYDCPTSFLVGDDASNRPARGILSFDISTLPGGIAEFERATFSGRTQSFGGDPIASLQALVLEHTTFAFPITASARTAAARGAIGVLTTSEALRTSTAAVTTALADDYQNRTQRGNRSQYRLAMQRETDNDGTGDAMTLHCPSATPPTLEVVYLIP